MAISVLEHAHQQHASIGKRHTHVPKIDLTQLEIAIPPSEAKLRTASRWKPLHHRPERQATAADFVVQEVPALHRSSSVRYPLPRSAMKRNGHSRERAIRDRPSRSHANALLPTEGKELDHNAGQTLQSSDAKFKIARKPVGSLGVSKPTAIELQPRTISSEKLDKSCSTLTSPFIKDADPELDLDTRIHDPFSSDEEVRTGTIKTSHVTITAPQTPRQQSCTPSLCSITRCSTHADHTTPRLSTGMMHTDPSNYLESSLNICDSADLTNEIDAESVYPASPGSSPLLAKWPYVPELFHGSRDARQLAADYRALLMEEMLDLQEADSSARSESNSAQETSTWGQPDAPDCVLTEREGGHTLVQSACELEAPAILNEHRRDSGIAISSPRAPPTRLRPSNLPNKDNEAISPLCLDDTEVHSSRRGPSCGPSPPQQHRPVSKLSSIHPAFRRDCFHPAGDVVNNANEQCVPSDDLTTLCYADFNAALKRPGLSAQEQLVAIEARIRAIDRMLARSRERKGEAERGIVT